MELLTPREAELFKLFLGGMGRSFDIWGKAADGDSFILVEVKAIEGDWQSVGNSLWMAMERTARDSHLSEPSEVLQSKSCLAIDSR